MNPTKFRLRVGFNLRVGGTEENSKGLTVVHEWDFDDPASRNFPALLRQLRYSLLSMITTAAYASVFGWLPDEELKEKIAGATQEECDRVLVLKRVSDPPDDFEVGGPPKEIT